MSTLLMAASPGATLESLDSSGISTGSGMQTSNSVELQINQATSMVNEGSSTRQIQKEEVLLLLNIFEQWLVRHSWPYASS